MMKVLMVNKFYYIKGGSETYYFALKRLLESKGHEVIDFSMQDDKNFWSPYSSYFVKNVDYNGKNSVTDKMKAAANIVYSVEAKKKFECLIKETKPDVIHLHLFQHQLSPSILDVIRKNHIPTVYTAHDLKMLCLNYKMMHHGRLCEECKNGKYYHCAIHKCVKDNFFKSCVNVVEGYVHKWRHSYDTIDQIITPSAFYKKMFEQFGISSDRVVHIPNFLDKTKPEVKASIDREQYYLCFGRLSEEKGIGTLLDAAINTKICLKLVGTGPMEDSLKQYVSKKKAHNIKFLGFKTGKELSDIVGNAKAVILPSEWYENGPYSAIEALQLGRPVIGSKIGGIPELVQGNGYLFESGNVDSLQKAILKLERLNRLEYDSLVENSFRLFEQSYTPKIHFRLLKETYEKAGAVGL